jgi:hypothetical protein
MQGGRVAHANPHRSPLVFGLPLCSLLHCVPAWTSADLCHLHLYLEGFLITQ